MSAAPTHELPPVRRWRTETLEWWKDIWASPMAANFLQADEAALHRLAIAIDDFWRTRSARARCRLAAHIRLEEKPFGLKPLDRARLGWSIR